jgi:predicted nuclease of predicted toxin-antitoxin system
MKLVIDMNLSPQWVSVLKSAGHEPIHWSQVGAANATDREIMEWARTNNHVVFTHDLDFGAILASTDADSPSVFQVRAQDISPKTLAGLVLSSLKKFEERLNEGALVTVNEKQARAHILPIRKQG